MACDVFRLSKPINGKGEVEETPVDEGKLGLREAVGRTGMVDFWLNGQGKWDICCR